MTTPLEAGAVVTRAMDASTAPRLIVINQSVAPAFMDWLGRLAAGSGPVELWCGTAPAEAGNGVTVRRFQHYDSESVATRLVTWVRFTLRVTWRLLRQGGRTPIFVATNPPLMPLAARLLLTLQGRPYGLLEWDIYPQILTTMGMVGHKNPISRIWHRSHASALRAAALTVTIGDHMAATLRHMSGDARLPVTVVPNWVDTDLLTPLPRDVNLFVQEQTLKDKLVVLYSGNLGATHAIETILEVARLLADERRLCFLIIGEGSKRSMVATAIAKARTPTLRLLPFQPAANLPQTLGSGHIGIVTLGSGCEGLSMPSKTYALMATGNAILGISQPPNDLADTIARHGCGSNFRPDEAPAISAWIRSLLADPAALAQLQAASRHAAVTNYSTTRCATALSMSVTAALLRETQGRIA